MVSHHSEQCGQGSHRQFSSNSTKPPQYCSRDNTHTPTPSLSPSLLSSPPHPPPLTYWLKYLLAVPLLTCNLAWVSAPPPRREPNDKSSLSFERVFFALDSPTRLTPPPPHPAHPTLRPCQPNPTPPHPTPCCAVQKRRCGVPLDPGGEC